jgi:lipopolysaccharide exporter
MALCTIILSIGTILTEFGAMVNIVRCEKNDLAQALPSIFSLNLLLAVCATVFVLLFAESLANQLQSEGLAPILRISVCIFFFHALGISFHALLAKELAFVPLMYIELMSWVISLLLTIYLAIEQYGVYALVWPYLSRYFVLNLGFVFFGIRQFGFPKFGHPFQLERNWLRIGGFESINQASSIFSGNIDKMIVSVFFGAEKLGLYSIASQLAKIPSSKINPLIDRVMFPVFSKIKTGKDQLQQWFDTVQTANLLVSLPIYIGLALVSSQLLSILVGSTYTAAALTMTILCGVYALQTWSSTSGSILQVFGRSDLLFYWNLIYTSIILATIWLANQWRADIWVVALGFLLATLGTLPLWFFFLRHVSGVKTHHLPQLALRHSIPAIAVGITVFALQYLVADLSIGAHVAVLTSAGALVWLVSIKIFEGPFLNRLFKN